MADNPILALDDDQYPQVSFGPHGDLPVNAAQATSLFRKWKQRELGDNPTSQTWAEFAKTVQYGHECVMVEWCGMWLGVETDGYTHS